MRTAQWNIFAEFSFKTAVTGKMEEEWKQSLFLWQRAAFYGSDEGARGAADSLRLRLAHLEFLHRQE